MKTHIILFGILMVLSLAACTSAKDKEAKANAEYTEEKTETLIEYKECVKNSGGDETKMKQCDAILKAVEALEGGK